MAGPARPGYRSRPVMAALRHAPPAFPAGRPRRRPRRAPGQRSRPPPSRRAVLSTCLLRSPIRLVSKLSRIRFRRRRHPLCRGCAVASAGPSRGGGAGNRCRFKPPRRGHSAAAVPRLDAAAATCAGGDAPVSGPRAGSDGGPGGRIAGPESPGRAVAGRRPLPPHAAPRDAGPGLRLCAASPAAHRRRGLAHRGSTRAAA
jgi:hypothetical protein